MVGLFINCYYILIGIIFVCYFFKCLSGYSFFWYAILRKRVNGNQLYLYSIFLKTNELKYTPVYIFIKFIFGLLSFFKICSTNLSQYKTIRGPMKQQMWGTLFILILFINSQQTYSTKTSYFLPMIVTTDFSAMLKTSGKKSYLLQSGGGQGVVE